MISSIVLSAIELTLLAVIVLSEWKIIHEAKSEPVKVPVRVYIEQH